MLAINSECGGMTVQDLYALLRIVSWLSPKRIFEIGTFRGMTTAHLALNSEAEIFTLDLPRGPATDLSGYSQIDRAAALQSREEVGREYQRFNVHGRIRQLFGDSRTFDYTPYRASMDLVLVDACHLFDYVMSDSRNALQILGRKGAILWHDFPNSIDVTRACKLLARELTILHLEGTWLALHLRGLSIPGAVSPGAAL
jgi:predicted O-methyltransferase YrrM